MNPCPSKYAEANHVQREDAKDILEKYAKIMQWRKDGQDKLLDIGCGPGDVTIDFILPKIPGAKVELVGVDKSKEMVDYANNQNRCRNVFFEQLDITGDIEPFLEAHPGGFDHITSFYCLHWAHDQEKAFKNIFNLLKPNSDCLLAFLISANIITIYKELSQFKKWKVLMSKLQDYFAPYFFDEFPEKSIDILLKATGLKNFSFEVRERSYIYAGLKDIKESTTVINPFWDKMSLIEQNNFFNDYLDVASKIGILQRDNGDEEKWKFVGLNKLAIIYARK